MLYLWDQNPVSYCSFGSHRWISRSIALLYTCWRYCVRNISVLPVCLIKVSLRVIFLAFCRHKGMLHFRIFSDYIYIQNLVDLQVLNKNVSFCNRNSNILASVYSIFQQNFDKVYFWYLEGFWTLNTPP